MRFPEFEGEWKSIKIKDFGKVITGNTPPTNDNENYGNDYLWASPVDLGQSKYIRNTKTKLSQKGFERIRKVPKNAILVTCIGSTIGKMGIASKYMSTNQQINSIITNENYDYNFVYYAIGSHFPKYLSSIATQAVPIISKSTFKELENYSPLLREQKKIATFLSLIDQRIETQNKIIEKLQSLMKGLNDTLFNISNPNAFMRFPEFSEDWNTYKISDLLDFFPTNSLSWEQLEYNGSSLYNLHYGLIHKAISTQMDLSLHHLPNIMMEFTPSNFTLCKNGDIAFADASEDYNDVGKVVEFFNCDNKQVICGLHTIHGRDKKQITIAGFKGYAFSSSAFRNQIRRLAQGTKIFSISLKNFNESYISIPSLKEQKKITDLLFSLSNKIMTEESTLFAYQQQKAYFLQNMFV
ncbi:MAG: restriction endonuclease subunit S [Bacteroides sp.]|nr:restriction endonuclease subunit S [Bacteroides sp.]